MTSATARLAVGASWPTGISATATTDAPVFGRQLKQLRVVAGLSQEALAERAGLSAHALSALERGARRVPYRSTVEALAGALQLSPSQRASLESTVIRHLGPRLRSPTMMGHAPGPAPAPVQLPYPPTRLLGREHDVASAQGLLRSVDVRLLTITGPGGIGKTRLALAVAIGMEADFPDGIWFVDLAPLTESDTVLPTIVRALGVETSGHSSLIAALVARLRSQRALLVLDNLEQVLGAAPDLAELLATCSGPKLLVTSRVRLRLRWEHALSLTPLAVPERKSGLSAEALLAVPSVTLFVERAQAVNPGFALTSDNAESVAAVCRHLEGLPLALEVAAARASVLTPTEILDWTRSYMSVLDSDALDLPVRQRSLRASMEWSHALLLPAERGLFRRLAAFAGGWSREAAAIVTRPEELGLDPIEGLTRLIDASLVQVTEDADGCLRFGLSEALRELGWEQLEESGEREAVERAHATYYLALMERGATILDPLERETWLGLVRREADNLRVALNWTAEHAETNCARRLASSMIALCSAIGNVADGDTPPDMTLLHTRPRLDEPWQRMFALAGRPALRLMDTSSKSH